MSVGCSLFYCIITFVIEFVLYASSVLRTSLCCCVQEATISLSCEEYRDCWATCMHIKFDFAGWLAASGQQPTVTRVIGVHILYI